MLQARLRLQTLARTALLNAGLRNTWLLQARLRTAGLNRCSRLPRPQLLTLPVRLTGLLRSAASRQSILSRAARCVAAIDAGIGAAERALFVDDAAADSLRGMHLAHEALVALHLLWRNRQRHRGEARAAGAGPDGEAAGSLCEKAEPPACAVIDFDPADLAVGVRI